MGGSRFFGKMLKKRRRQTFSGRLIHLGRVVSLENHQRKKVEFGSFPTLNNPSSTPNDWGTYQTIERTRSGLESFFARSEYVFIRGALKRKNKPLRKRMKAISSPMIFYPSKVFCCKCSILSYRFLLDRT